MKGSIEHQKLKNSLNKRLSQYIPDYTKNCGKCKMCTNPDYLKDSKAECPECQSKMAHVDAWNNPNNNWVVCPNNHRYNIRQQMDLDDVELHQQTIRKLGL
jgi:LDH2 family malate/lactate/ureidoglycolate dehydrogenase